MFEAMVRFLKGKGVFFGSGRDDAPLHLGINSLLDRVLDLFFFFLRAGDKPAATSFSSSLMTQPLLSRTYLAEQRLGHQSLYRRGVLWCYNNLATSD